jgi:hypothetical protein
MNVLKNIQELIYNIARAVALVVDEVRFYHYSAVSKTSFTGKLLKIK